MRPAAVTVSDASSWSSSVRTLLPGVESGSNWSDALTWATFVTVPASWAVTSSTSVVDAPLGSVPTVQTPPANVPCAGVAVSSVTPAGTASATSTLVASLGPSLVSVIVKVAGAPAATVPGATDLFRRRSARCGVTPTVAVSLAGFGSNEFDVTISAVLLIAFGVSTVATIVRVSLAPFGRESTSQTPLVGLKVPPVVVCETYVRPVSRSSRAATVSAGSGPSLLRPTVNVIVSPTFGVGLSTDLVMPRSADNGFSVAWSWSSSPCESLPGVESGSSWSLVSTWATLVCGVPASTLVTTCNDTLPPAGTVPTVQIPVAVSKSPPLSSLTQVTPLGRSSRTVTFVASSGPVLLTVTVQVTCSPLPGRSLSTVLTTDRSAAPGTVIVAVASSSSAGSPLSGVESGSAWSTPVTSATFVITPVPVTSATRLSVAEPPSTRSPTAHTSVAAT